MRGKEFVGGNKSALFLSQVFFVFLNGRVGDGGWGRRRWSRRVARACAALRALTCPYAPLPISSPRM